MLILFLFIHHFELDIILQIVILARVLITILLESVHALSQIVLLLLRLGERNRGIIGLI
mgnify:CR=1 FL=1